MGQIRSIHMQGTKKGCNIPICKEKNPKINIGQPWRWWITTDKSEVTCKRCLAYIDLHSIKWDINQRGKNENQNKN